jgi:probable rRNA maturation factor
MTRSRARRPPAPVALAWQATEPIPRGWRAWLSRLLAGYLAALGYPGRGVTLLVADDAELKRLNARHRGRHRATDILSFSYLPGARAPPSTIGELAVSLERARAQAQANGWSLRTELARLLAHGCVHLLGYDHATRAQDRAMRRIEERLLTAAGFPGLYPPAAPRQAATRAPRKRKRP